MAAVLQGAEQMQFGLAHADITPPVGTRFGGFWLERPEPGIGVHDPLLAQALVATSPDGGGAALISCDLQLISPPVVRQARERINAITGIAPEAIMVHATHNHAAPGGDWAEAYVEGAADYFAEPEVAQLIVDGIVDAAVSAWQSKFTAQLSAVREQVSGIGRSRSSAAEPAMAPAAVILVTEEQGQVRGVIAWYSCHPSILGPDNRDFSADFPGVVRQHLALAYPGAVPLYMNGPAAEISTRQLRLAQTHAEVKRLGGILASELLGLLSRVDALAPGPVGGLCSLVNLPLAPLPADAPTRQRERRQRIPSDHVPCPVQVLRMGALALVGIGAEFGHQAGWGIGARSPIPLTLPLAPANGSVGNVPSRLFGPEAVDLVIGEVDRLLATEAVGGDPI
jgi:neutral ceramidase